MFEKELNAMILAGRKASDEIMKIYKKGFNVTIKSDQSPVTDADIASNKVIRETLSSFSDIGWLSEEDYDDRSRLEKRKLFVIDPLDGTSDFVERDDSFGVNIALVVDRKPVCSVIAIPAQNKIYYAIKDKGSYFLDGNESLPLHVSDRLDHLVFLTSKTHSSLEEENLIKTNHDFIDKVVPLGASTKAVAIAEGKADCCIRYTKMTKEWDVCAPDLLVREAGGLFVDTLGEPFVYNRENVYNMNGYCMFNRKENLKFIL